MTETDSLKVELDRTQNPANIAPKFKIEETSPTPFKQGACRPFTLVDGARPRKPVQDVTDYPWNSIAFVELLHSDYPIRVNEGTGFLITPRLALTAAHVLTDRPFTQLHLEFPSMDGNSKATRVLVEDFRYDSSNDIALLRIAPCPRPSIKLGDVEIIEEDGFVIAGYGIQLDSKASPFTETPPLTTSIGPMVRIEQGHIIYDINTAGGDSGSPILKKNNAGVYHAVAIHTTVTKDQKRNSGPLISDSVFESIQHMAALLEK